MTFFEIGGKELAGHKGCAHDLLNARAPVRLCSDTHGTTHVLGAVVRAAHDGAGLLQTLSDGLALRCTEVTERNANSSRSHAVCALRFCASGRTLRLADLAGSERNLDTVGMSAAEHRASAEINKALFALKECFRMAALQRDAPHHTRGALRVPFRASALTRVLRGCFVDASHRTALIAAVAPGSADMFHTFNTLDHACLMAPHLALRTDGVACAPGGGGGGGGAHAASATYAVCLDVPMRRRRRAELVASGGQHEELAYERLPVHLWSAEHVRSWLANAHGGRFAHVVIPAGTDGRALLNLSARRLSELVEDADRVGRGGGGGAVGPSAVAAPAAPGAPGPAANEVGWYISSQAKIGRALFAALRDEQRGRFSSLDALAEAS